MTKVPGIVTDAEWNHFVALRSLPPTTWWPDDVPDELKQIENRRWWATMHFEAFAGESLLSFAERANIELNLPKDRHDPSAKALVKPSEVVNLLTLGTEGDVSSFSRLKDLLPDGTIHFGNLRWLDHYHSLRDLCKTGSHLSKKTAYSLVSAIYLLLGPRISSELFRDIWFPCLTAPVEVVWQKDFLKSERLRDKKSRLTLLGHNGVYNV
jgi:hypothetical protein